LPRLLLEEPRQDWKAIPTTGDIEELETRDELV
jgi:hypothetical protein